jgi:hypothetical protein
VVFTTTQYIQTDPEADHQVANALAELIISGSLAPVEATGTAGHGGTDKAAQPSRSIRRFAFVRGRHVIAALGEQLGPGG